MRRKSGSIGYKVYLLAALREVENVADRSDKEACLEDIAEAQGKADDKSAALITVGPIKERRPGSLIRIARALAKAGDAPAALAIAVDVEVDYRNEVLENIAAAQADSGDIPAALETVAGVKNDAVVPEALKSIASAQAKAGDVRSALRTVARIESVDCKSMALYDIAAAQAKTGDVQTAVRTAMSIEDKDSKAYAIDFIADRPRFSAQVPVRQRISARITSFCKLLPITDLSLSAIKSNSRNRGGASSRR